MQEISTLGKRIYKFRIERRLTQKTLAEKSGLAQSSIARIEGGDRQDMRCNDAMRVADALDVGIDELLYVDRGVGW